MCPRKSFMAQWDTPGQNTIESIMHPVLKKTVRNAGHRGKDGRRAARTIKYAIHNSAATNNGTIGTHALGASVGCCTNAASAKQVLSDTQADQG